MTVDRGWLAKGLLRPLWGKVGGRDELAKLTGIQATVLSSYNSGSRPLGIRNGRRIADALGVSLLEVGAPPLADEESLPLLETLRNLQTSLEEHWRRLDEHHDRLVELESRSSRRRARPARDAS